MAKTKNPPDAKLPVSIVASKAVARRERYAGRVPLSQLPRLRELLAAADGDLQVELEASRDGQGAGWLRGRIEGELALTCQRGLHPYTWPCALDFELRLVDSESEEEQVLQEQDPYLVRDDRLPLQELVEDEVLLGLPMLPRCPDPGCLDRLK